MRRHLHFIKFIIISLALHAIMIAAVFVIGPGRIPIPVSIPVDIVTLPEKKPLKPPVPPRRTPHSPPPSARIPKPTRPESVPKPDKFGTDDDILVPKTSPDGAGRKNQTDETAPAEKPDQGGPLPFLSKNDIEQLARKGMPEKKPGDDSVTLDTDEFKFISYNRWLKIKVESVLKYPELAAISGYQGSLYIQFDIMKDGSLGNFRILKSSGYKILDDEAERSIRTAAPFQPLPDEWGMDHYSIRAAVIFYLGTGYLR